MLDRIHVDRRRISFIINSKTDEGCWLYHVLNPKAKTMRGVNNLDFTMFFVSILRFSLLTLIII
jgi:hypothetical protein